MEENKIPALVCRDRSSGNVMSVDTGDRHCKRSYLGYFLGLSTKWKPRYECGNINAIHRCDEYTQEEIKTLLCARSRRELS